MKNLVYPFAAAALLLATAVAAPAQETKPVGLSIRAGGFFPSDSDARDESDIWFALGLDYKLKDLTCQAADGTATHLSLSADWFESGDFRQFPVLLNLVGTKNQMYYSVGVGVTFAKYRARYRPIVDGGGDGWDGGFEPTSDSWRTDEDTLFAYSLGIGYQFQQGQTPVFLEARYFGCEKSVLNGFAVYVGVRL